MPDTADPAPFTPSRLGLLALGLLGVGAWLLSHAYRGLYHDAGLYTLQALARLHPDSLSSDVFLAYGSQDRFTVFSPLYAAAARWLGVEPAAALLTLLMQAGLLAAAWQLNRAVLARGPALLGIAFLVAFPGDYGSGRIFSCIEPFLTPRMAAEAAVLASLAAAWRGSKGMAVVLWLLGAMLHPLMAMAGAVALYGRFAGDRRPLAAMIAAAAGVAVLVLFACAMPAGAWGRFEADWLRLVVDRSPYLFLASWTLDDWSHAATLAATLAVGMRTLDDAPARSLARLALITGLAGLALTAVACDLLHLVRFTELQPWRWQWLPTAVAALLLPAILVACWHRGTHGRTAMLLLVAAWLFAAGGYALFAAAAALPALGLQRLKAAEARWVLWGAAGLLTIAAVWRVATILEFTEIHYLDAAIPLGVRRAMSAARDGSVAAAAMALCVWLSCGPQPAAGRAVLLAIALLAAAGCAALLPQALAAWTRQDYPPRQAQRFAALRALIPPRAEVFWPGTPLGTWLLLERPSYLSVIQTSGLVFSETGARELAHRAAALGRSIAPDTFMSWGGGTGLNLSREQLAGACDTGAFAFLVSDVDLGWEPVAAVPAGGRQIRLYRCPRVSSAAAPAGITG